MKIAVMQPTYLPWMGYFDLMNQVDTFVILDAVAFSKQSFHQRNRIKVKDDFLWLTIPVQSSGKMGQPLNQTLLAKTPFLTKHLKSIETAYQKAAFYENFHPQLKALYESLQGETHLMAVNLAFIHLIKEALGIRTPFVFASQINARAGKGSRLVDICQSLGATTYITPPGAVDYLKNEQGLFQKAGINLGVHTFDHPSYTQLYPPFISHLSALDLLMNEGNNGKTILNQGARPAVPFLEFSER